MMRDLLLASGLLLTTASQLRPAGAALGPGELLLVIWLVLMLSSELARLGPPLSPALSRLLVFWAVFGLALSLGTLAGFAIDDHHDPDLFRHDAVAYPLLAAVSCLMVVEPEAGRRLRRVAWLVALLGNALLAAALAIAWLSPDADTGPVDPWYWDRFRGFSENPNQLALLCLVLIGVALHGAEEAPRRAARMVSLACAILPVVVGRLTKSDTFTLALIVGGPLFAALKLRGWLVSSRPATLMRAACAGAVVVGLPLWLSALAPFGYAIAFQAQELAQGVLKDAGKAREGEAALRFDSWKQAIGRGVESGMLGLGPGPHLQIPALLVTARQREEEPRNVQHPAVNGTANFEAHNTFLDLFTQGGLLATLSFVWLATVAFVAAYRAKLDAMTTLLGSLTVFAIFHLIVRHPLFWFAIGFALVMGRLPGQTSRRWARS